jgi:hypothetical protein
MGQYRRDHDIKGGERNDHPGRRVLESPIEDQSTDPADETASDGRSNPHLGLQPQPGKGDQRNHDPATGHPDEGCRERVQPGGRDLGHDTPDTGQDEIKDNEEAPIVEHKNKGSKGSRVRGVKGQTSRSLAFKGFP